MSESQRNILILVVIAVIGSLFFSEQLGLGTGVLGLVLNVAFTVMIVWLLVVLYQRHSGTIAQMGHTPRLVLQICGATLLFLLIAGSALLAAFLPYPFGLQVHAPMIFWPALLACAFGIWWAWQQRTSRW